MFSSLTRKAVSALNACLIVVGSYWKETPREIADYMRILNSITYKFYYTLLLSQRRRWSKKRKVWKIRQEVWTICFMQPTQHNLTRFLRSQSVWRLYCQGCFSMYGAEKEPSSNLCLVWRLHPFLHKMSLHKLNKLNFPLGNNEKHKKVVKIYIFNITYKWLVTSKCKYNTLLQYCHNSVFMDIFLYTLNPIGDSISNSNRFVLLLKYIAVPSVQLNSTKT